MLIVYHLHFLSDDEFEHLVCDVCQDLLGFGTVRFAKGKDGGRDGKFEGTAQKYPSEKSPWSGKFLVQAKHTSKGDASCADYDFTKIVDEEIERVKKIKTEEDVHHYLVFTNRKLSGIKHLPITKKISDATQVKNVELIGNEVINSFLKSLPDIVARYGLDKLAEPLRFFEGDLRNVITKLAEEIDKIAKNYQPSGFAFLPKEKKNELNKLSESYFQHMKENSLSYFDQIHTFLSDPKNKDCKKWYDNTVAELQSKITAKRDEFAEFDHIFNYIFDYLIDRHDDLKQHRKLVLVFLHYMYFNCDLGRKE